MPWVEEDASAKGKDSGAIVSSWMRKCGQDKIEPDLEVVLPTEPPPAVPGDVLDNAHLEESNSVEARAGDDQNSPKRRSSRLSVKLQSVTRAKDLWMKARIKTGAHTTMTSQWQSVKEKVTERIEMHKITLLENRPEVALLIPAEDEEQAENLAGTGKAAQEHSKSKSIVFSMSPRFRLCISASLLFHGKPAKLLVVQLAVEKLGNGQRVEATPAEQLTEIEKELKKSDVKLLEDTVPWPLHEDSVSEALLAREAEVLALESGSWFGGNMTRFLHLLRILSPDEEGPVMNAFRDQYGFSAAYACVWGFFFVQCLWILIPVVLLSILFKAKPASSGTDRIKFEFLKFILICWGASVAVLCSTRFLGNQAVKEQARRRLKKRRSSDIITETKRHSKPVRALTLIFGALPCLALFGAFCMFTLLMTTNLILHIIYVWGDCYNLHTPDEICRDAEKTHGVWGWAAEVGCDIGLAILFELFFSLSSSLTHWISDLLSFEYENDRILFKSMLEVFLAAMERIGFVGSLAFAFVPQWSEPHSGNTIDMSRSCDDLWLGESSYTCFQRRLPLQLRRYLLEKLMKGPFVAAPFLAILIKTIIPYVVYKLSLACDYLIRCPLSCFPFIPFRLLFRFFTLVFTLEGDNVGCFKFVHRGWPFSQVSVDAPPENSSWDSLKEYKNGIFSILDQAVLKPFTPADELMELEMSFLWVLFFTPLMPMGVITTLIAKVLEINFDQLKMLHVRRRHFPVSEKVLRREQTAFVNAAVLMSFGWTLGLSLITYNDNLHKWGVGGHIIMISMGAWFIFCGVLGCSKSMTLGCALGYARLLDYKHGDQKGEDGLPDTPKSGKSELS